MELQYLINSDGEKTGVFIPIDEYRNLLTKFDNTAKSNTKDVLERANTFLKTVAQVLPSNYKFDRNEANER